MNIQPMNLINYNQQSEQPLFTAKKVVTKTISAKKTLDAMALMAAPMMAAGLTLGKNNDTADNSQMSDDEFKAKKKEVKNKLKESEIELPKSFKLTKNNILLADRLLKSPELVNECHWWLQRVIDCDNNELQQAKIEFLDNIENEKDLISNADIIRTLRFTIKEPKDAKKCIEIQKIVNDNPELKKYIKSNNNSTALYDLFSITYDAKNLDKIMTNEKLKDNFVMLAFNKLTDQENYDEILDILSENDKLLENKNLQTVMQDDKLVIVNTHELAKILKMENEEDINNILGCCYCEYDAPVGKLNAKAPLIRTFINSKELFNNENLTKNINKIVEDTNSSQISELKVEIMKKIDSNKKLLGNNELMKNLGEILLSINTKREAMQVLNMLDKMANT